MTSVPGNGDVILETDSLEASHWVKQALDKLAIHYSVKEYDDEFENNFRGLHWTEYIFKIEDIKQKCPNLYAIWHKLNLSNLFGNVFRDRKTRNTTKAYQ